jgi:hypothetical protein
MPDGTTDPLVPFSKVSGPDEALNRLSHIEMKIKQGLTPGEYQIQARAGHTRGSLTDSFDFEVSDSLPILIKPGEEKPEDPMSLNYSFDLEEYKDLLKENARLTAERKMMDMEVEFWKKKAMEAPANLADQQPEKTTWDYIAKVMEDIGPGLIGMGSQYMEQRDREITLQENAAKSKAQPQKKLAASRMAKKTFNEVLEIKVNRLTGLEQTNPEAFEAELDKLEQDDARMYAAVCEAMGIEEYDEEDLEEDDDDESYEDDGEGGEGQ